jgi:hypothetical protein
MIRNDVKLLYPVLNVQVHKLRLVHFLPKKVHKNDEFLSLKSPVHVLITTIVFLAKAILASSGTSQVYDTFVCANQVNHN